MIDRHLSGQIAEPQLLQDQQFADPEAWDSFVTGHFDQPETQDAQEAANSYLAGRQVTDGAVNLHNYQLYTYNHAERHQNRLAELIDQYEHEHAHNLQEIQQQFADLEAWRDWILGHFEENERQDVRVMIDAHLSG